MSDVQRRLENVLEGVFYPDGASECDSAALQALEGVLRKHGGSLTVAANGSLAVTSSAATSTAAELRIPSLVINDQWVYPRRSVFTIQEGTKGKDTFSVYNAAKEPVLRAKGDPLAMSKQIWITDVNGTKLVKVGEDAMHIHTTFKIKDAKVCCCSSDCVLSVLAYS